MMKAETGGRLTKRCASGTLHGKLNAVSAVAIPGGEEGVRATVVVFDCLALPGIAGLP